MGLNKAKAFGKVQWFRLAIQVASVVVTAAGSFTLIRTLGMPLWAFTITVVLAGLFFCGWACPFGAVQEWLGFAGKRVLGVSRRVPGNIDRYLLWSRYVLAGLAAGGIFAMAALDSRRTFVMTVVGRSAATAAYVVLGAILLLSIFVERPFCKYLCGFGAIFGLCSIPRIVAIKRDGALCANCGACTKACGMGVETATAHTVRDPNCINCGRCLEACPVPGALRAGITLPCRADADAVKRKYLG